MIPFFAYLIKSSVSLALLYCLFRFSMRRQSRHMLNRILLLGILMVSAIIPFLNIQFFYEEVAIKPVEIIRELVSSSLVQQEPVTAPSTFIQPVAEVSSISVNPWLVGYLTGIALLLLRIVLGITKVAQIIGRAEKRRLRKIVLAVVKDLIQPFTFLNKVVLSEKDFNEHKDIVVAHEYAHIKYLHAIDLMICELFTVLQFFNPFMWLLRRDLKLIHEYQADQAVLNKGIDAQQYQLLVLEKAVGERRFAMANHFTQKPILKRLTMMNKNKIDRWAAVRLILFVPLLAVLLQAFARPELITTPDQFIPVLYVEDEAEKWLSKWTIDNIGKGMFQPEMKPEEKSTAQNNILVVLMNTKDQYLVEGKMASKESIKMAVSGFLQGANPDGGNGPDFMEKEIPFVGRVKVSNGWISYRHDVASSREAVNYTLRKIGEAYLEAREAKAFILFGEKYFDLDEKKQEAINMVVPVRFSYESPKLTAPSVWLPFDEKASGPEPVEIHFKSSGEVLVGNYTYKSHDEFYENLKVWKRDLDKFNEGRRSKAFYRANLVFEYDMPDDAWNKLELALYRNSIHVKEMSKPEVKSKTTSVSKRKPYKSPFATLQQPETRDVNVLYISLFNDEEIDLTEIRNTALECVDTKKSAVIECEDGVSENQIQSVKRVLKEIGIQDVAEKRLGADGWLNNWTIDNLQNLNGGFVMEEYELVPPPPGSLKSGLKKYEKGKSGVKVPTANVFPILINSKNALLASNEPVNEKELMAGVERFLKGKHPFNDSKPGPEFVTMDFSLTGPVKITKGVITIRHDMETDRNFINNLLQKIGMRHLDLREKMAKEKFGQDYFSLSNENREVVEKLVPVRVFILEPKVVR
uniref:M56 family metallopeptidase n=1 Tax=uncultured Draconibacterium sp. TaxID=1573823 RepID=UPI0032175975